MIVIRVRLKVSQENETNLVSFLKNEVQQNKTLVGCLAYSFYKDVFEENTFLIYEEWDSMVSFELYKNSDAFGLIMAALAPLLMGPPDSAYFDATIVGPNY